MGWVDGGRMCECWWLTLQVQMFFSGAAPQRPEQSRSARRRERATTGWSKLPGRVESMSRTGAMEPRSARVVQNLTGRSQVGKVDMASRRVVWVVWVVEGQGTGQGKEPAGVSLGSRWGPSTDEWGPMPCLLFLVLQYPTCSSCCSPCCS